MAKKKGIGPAFKRVLDCFDSKAEFARQLGLKDRQLVREWEVRYGYIPLKWAVQAALVTGGKVTAVEIVNETTRIMQRRLAEQEAVRELRAAEGAE